MMKVKFCGLKRPCDVLWAKRLQPEYVGFVFAGRKRRISDLQARKLRKLLDRKIPAVGVFVNEPAEHIIRLVQKDIIQAVQIHGQEGEADIRRIRQAVICPIIQAFSLNGDEDVARAEKSGADYILLDAAGGGSVPGTGTRHHRSGNLLPLRPGAGNPGGHHGGKRNGSKKRDSL